ncbi:transcription factor, partial [Trifolium medium]|nr:transcription factor [Trifolium medium]
VNEYARSSSAPRHIQRTPTAIQALPVQSQTLGQQQNSVTNLDSLITSSSSATYVSLSNPTSADPYNAILSDAERQQLFSRTPLNMPQVSAATQNRGPTVNMSAPTHNRAPPANMSAVTHNRAPSQLQNPQYRTGILNDFRNSHLQHTLNPQAHQPMQPLNTQLSHIQQGGSQANAAGPAANSQQARVMASSHAARQGNSQAGIVWTAGATVYSEQARAIATALAARQSQSISSQNQTCVAATYFT